MIIELVLCGIIVAQQIVHYAERRDLYDRLMSRDVNEYKHARARDKPPAGTVSRHEQIMKRWREPDADFGERKSDA